MATTSTSTAKAAITATATVSSVATDPTNSIGRDTVEAAHSTVTAISTISSASA